MRQSSGTTTIAAFFLWCAHAPFANAWTQQTQKQIALRGATEGTRLTLTLAPTQAETDLQEAENVESKAYADFQIAGERLHEAEARAMEAEEKAEAHRQAAIVKWMHVKYWVRGHEKTSALILTVVLVILLIAGCFLAGIADDFWHIVVFLNGFSYNGKVNMCGLVMFLIGGTVIFWHLGIIQSYLESILMVIFLGCGVMGVLFTIAREMARPVAAAAAEAKDIVHHLYDSLDDVLDFLGLSECSSDDDVSCWTSCKKKSPEPSAESSSEPKAKEKASTKGDTRPGGQRKTPQRKAKPQKKKSMFNMFA